MTGDPRPTRRPLDIITEYVDMDGELHKVQYVALAAYELLRAENAALREVVEAAKAVSNHWSGETHGLVETESHPHRSALSRLKNALSQERKRRYQFRGGKSWQKLWSREP